MTSAPFAVSAEGWGEFPIGIEIFIRDGGSVKLTHLLRLNSPDSIVVNETFDTIVLAQDQADPFPELPKSSNVPVFSEYISRGGRVEYVEIENQFLSCNELTLTQLNQSIEKLTSAVLQKESEIFSVLNRHSDH